MHKVCAFVDGNMVPLPFNFNALNILFPETIAKRIENKLLFKYKYNSKIPIKEFMCQDDEDLKFLAEYINEKIF